MLPSVPTGVDPGAVQRLLLVAVLLRRGRLPGDPEVVGAQVSTHQPAGPAALAGALRCGPPNTLRPCPRVPDPSAAAAV